MSSGGNRFDPRETISCSKASCSKAFICWMQFSLSHGSKNGFTRWGLIQFLLLERGYRWARKTGSSLSYAALYSFVTGLIRRP
ncbi:hypothetical protein SAMN02927923_03375 [Microvirga guangxiensis]|uniref:Uncharacterized protein n=1 Tax=Microvirga guangxiensis TaxID=549386 RepID=A0A1G5KL65_9HYPH|nr:hypothetical protein SAMN02927923_03375 [Microvirga guangxiensis]